MTAAELQTRIEDSRRQIASLTASVETDQRALCALGIHSAVKQQRGDPAPNGQRSYNGYCSWWTCFCGALVGPVEVNDGPDPG